MGVGVRIRIRIRVGVGVGGVWGGEADETQQTEMRR